MAGGIATRYSLAERESMAAWDEWCMEKPLTAAEIRLSEELDKLASGRIPELWKRNEMRKLTEQQRKAMNEACRRWREQHKEYNRVYKAANKEKLAAQERARYRASMTRKIMAEAESA